MDLLGVALWLLLRGRIRLAWRELGIALGWRRITPRHGERLPSTLVVVEPLGDTGGAYRPAWRPQDPAKDPDEPYGGESSSRGSDHAWSNCTMSSGAVALAYETRGELTPWGGRLRHEQGDLEGGTDLYDLRDAWRALGEELVIRSGAGWAALVDAHEAGKAIVIQGEGDCPGSGTFTGGHACAIGTETRSSDGAWLWGDPVVSGWQWAMPGPIKAWAERWQTSIAFATSHVVAEPEPEPEPAPPPAPPAEPEYTLEELAPIVERAVEYAVTASGDLLVAAWLAWLRAPAPALADRWGVGCWADPELELEALVDVDGVPADPCEPGAPAAWSRGPLPAPVRDALGALLVPAAWGGNGSRWRAVAWRS